VYHHILAYTSGIHASPHSSLVN